MKDERLFDCVGISGCTRGNVCDLGGRCYYAKHTIPELSTTKEPEVWTATLTGPDGHSESICTKYPDVLLKWLIAHSERFQIMTSMKIVPGAYASPGDASEMRGSGFMPMPPGRTYCGGGGGCPNFMACVAAGTCQKPPDEYEFRKGAYAWNCQHGAGRCPNALGCMAAGLCQSLPPDLG